MDNSFYGTTRDQRGIRGVGLVISLVPDEILVAILYVWGRLQLEDDHLILQVLTEL